jgi:uncharacterized protein YukE
MLVRPISFTTPRGRSVAGSSAGDSFSINPAEVQSVAPQFSTASTDLQTALTQLTTALGALGAPWGNDTQGEQFGNAYTPQHDALIKSFGVLVTGLASIHDGLSAHADNHSGADAHATAAIHNIR